MPAPELDFIIPAYNEESVIVGVIGDFEAAFHDLGIDYRIVVLDDGSSDGTLDALERYSSDHPRVVVRSHSNRGHGPTILEGYRGADSEWVGQADGDGEVPAENFVALWTHRSEYDLLAGVRQGRPNDVTRRSISFIARLAIRIIWGSTIQDANVPFRLMRRRKFEEIFRVIPDAFLTPNLALSGLARWRRLRVLELPVRFESRKAGSSSLRSLRLFKFAARALIENIKLGLIGRRHLSHD